MKNKETWIREFTDVVCPKCEEYYLIRDKRKYTRAKKVKLDSGKIIKIDKLKRRDILECSECGIIRKYKGEKTEPFTTENYEKHSMSHGDLVYKKSKRNRKEKHLTRLHSLKILKRLVPYDIIEKELGKEFMILNIMKGINRIVYDIQVILLSYGADKTRINVKLLEYLMSKLKEENDNI